MQLPVEVATFFTTMQFHLPDLEELRSIQHELAESVGTEVKEEAVEAALGLTEFEAETAFALSLVLRKQFCPEVITEQKMQMIRRTGLMEFWPLVPIDQVGGLEQLKQPVGAHLPAALAAGLHYTVCVEVQAIAGL